MVHVLISSYSKIKILWSKPTIFHSHSNSFAIWWETNTSSWFLQEFYVQHFVFGWQVPDPESLVITHCGTVWFLRMSGQAPQFTVHMTLKRQNKSLKWDYIDLDEFHIYAMNPASFMSPMSSSFQNKVCGFKP